MAADDQFKHSTKESFLLIQLADMREDIKALGYHLRGDMREIRIDVKELAEQRSADILNLSVQLQELKTKSKMWGAGVATLISAGISLAAIYFQSRG